jgi:succinate-semialdehyde dehydrogenase
MFAVKGRNSIIISPHPASKEHLSWLVDLFQEVLEKHNAPKNLIQFISEPTIELTNELMSAVDVVVATGGSGMVKSAYSSGTPALGVGPGNIQCVIDKDADIEDAVPKIIDGRIFDNGIICSGEQTAITPVEKYDEVIAEFKKNGTYYVDDKAEKEKFKETLFPEGEIDKNLVGQSVQDIASAVGVDIPEDTRMIMIKEEVSNKDSVLRKEKMFPVITAFEYEDFEQALEIVQNNLDLEGKGHTVCIHSNTKENIEKLGQAATASRVVVNAPCATTAGGSFQNGFACTTTLGCGSWGNNSISENLTYTHLLNTTTIGYKQEDSSEPTDEELWNG